MPRPQFSLKTMLWLTVAVVAFCAGNRFARYLAVRRADPEIIRAVLDEKTDLVFTDEPLSDVIEYLRQRHDIDIRLDNQALSDAGVASDTPVTRNIKGITLRSALKLLLIELDLTYMLQNGTLLITSQAEAEAALSTRALGVPPAPGPKRRTPKGKLIESPLDKVNSPRSLGPEKVGAEKVSGTFVLTRLCWAAICSASCARGFSDSAPA